MHIESTIPHAKRSLAPSTVRRSFGSPSTTLGVAQDDRKTGDFYGRVKTLPYMSVRHLVGIATAVWGLGWDDTQKTGEGGLSRLVG